MNRLGLHNCFYSAMLFLLLISLHIEPVFGNQTVFEPVITDAEYTVQKTLNTESGLPANGISGVLQDSRGYIWAATFNGLIRYDGKRIRVYNTGNIPGLETNRFIEVVEDSEGNIWAGLEYRSLVKIDQDTTYVYEIDQDLADTNTYVTNIFFDDAGKIWVGTNFGLFILEGENFRKVDSIPSYVIQKIDQRGSDIYVLSEFHLHTLDLNGENEEVILEINNSEIQYKNNYSVQALEEVERFWNIIWYEDYFLIIHEGGIVQFRENDYEIVLYAEDINQTILHGLKYKNGRYYIFGVDGLYRIEDLYADQIQAHRYTYARVTDMIFDHEDSVWISTSANGLMQFVDTPVYQGDKYDVLSQIPVTAILEGRNETLWVGTNCGGLYAFDNSSSQNYGLEEGISNICVWSIMEQSDGTIWAGTWGAGVFYKPEGADRFERFNPDIMEDVTAILSVYEDSQENIWFGSFGRGLYRFNGEETELIRNQNGRNVSAVRMIYEDDSGMLLFASDNGIGYYENGHIVKADEFNQLYTRNYRTIKKDSAGRFWFGSYGGGIYVLNPGGESRIVTTEQGLYDNTISQIQFDREDNLWLAGNMGVFFIDKDQLDLFFNGDIDEFRVSRIGVNEGLPIRETTGGFMPSSHLNRNGELYIPTVQGMAVLDTGRMQLNQHLPNIYFEEVEIDGVVYQAGAVDEIQHDAHRIIFRFTALSFKNPDHVQFQYMLEGLDTRWQDGDNTREVVYTTLSPGDYRLLVRASNNDGFWNEKGAVFAFSVYPPFWQTAWFYLLIFVLISLLLFAVYRYRVQAIRRYNLILKKEVDERTRELKASNNELKQLINEKNKLHKVLAHDLRSPFTSILGHLDLLKMNFEQTGDEENVQLTDMILNSGRSTLNLLENLLNWTGVNSGGLKAEKKSLNIQALVAEAKQMIEAQATFKNVDIISNIDQEIWVIADQNMISTVLRNLISNAIKFSGHQSKVEIDVEEKEDEVIVSVKDFGVGIQTNELEKLFDSNNVQPKLGTGGESGIGMGLQICKEFIDKHEGKLWVDSTPAMGSTFYFTLKKARQRETAEL